MSVFIETITIKNLLSFDEEGVTDFELKPLNVLIGANASGKSNFVHSLELLCSTATGIGSHLSRLGGMIELLHKNSEEQVMSLAVTLAQDENAIGANYSINVASVFGQYEIQNEYLRLCQTKMKRGTTPAESFPLFERAGEKAWLRVTKRNEGNGTDQSVQFEVQELGPKEFDFTKSIFEQRNDPIVYPDITTVGNIFSRSLYGGFFTAVDVDKSRNSNKADDFGWYLWRDGSNLPMILSKLDKSGALHSEILPRLREFYPKVRDIRLNVEGGRVELSVWEDSLRKPVSLNSMSTGTIAFLRILAALYNPEPHSRGRLFCFEEPETGFHPEALPILADCMKDAPTPTQIIITTHSPLLVECFQPEDIVVVEKPDASTQLERKSRNELRRWLKRYTLGELWLKGVIGGTRY